MFKFLFLFLLPGFITAQTESFIINGKILNQAKKPIEGAFIIDNTGTYTNVSDSLGMFVLSINSEINKLIISHLGYKTKVVNINKELFKRKSYFLKITLSEKPYKLNEVEIKGNNTEIEYKNTDVWVLDYELTRQGIFILTNKSSFGNKNLVLLDYYGDTVSYRLIKRNVNTLYKDPANNVFLIGNDSVWQLFYNEKKILLLYPNSIKKINSLFLSVAGNTNMFFIQKIYSDFNQTINYYYVNKKTKEKKLLIRITNEITAENNKQYFESMLNNTIKHYNKMGDFDDTKVLDECRKNINEDLFFKLILSKPIYDPVEIINDTIIIFDFEDDKILFYDFKLKLVKQTSIKFHKSKYWDNKIFIDISSKHCYAKFIRNGIVTLKEINLNTGQVIGQFSLSHPYPKKIRINNNAVYYLYNNLRTGMQSKRHLYKYTIKK